jgi:hypothetical protein
MVVVLAIAALAGVAYLLLKVVPMESGNLSFDDLVTLATNAGFSGADAQTAAAIALAESSGNPQAVGDTAITSGGSIGLWQINLQAHPEYTAATLTNSTANAAAAYAIYSAAGNSFSPWSTYNSGAYLSYLPSSSNVAVASATQPAADGSDGSGANDTSAVDSASLDNSDEEDFEGVGA